jgi:hypothetical protein
VDHGVGLRAGQPVRVEGGEEADLELAAGDVAADLMCLEQPADGRDAAAPRVAGDEGGEGERVAEPADLGLVDRPLELGGGEHGGEVEERARGRGDRDPVAARDLVGREHDVMDGHVAA